MRPRLVFPLAAFMSLGFHAALGADTNSTRVDRLENTIDGLKQRFDVAQIYNRPPADIDVDIQDNGDAANLTMRIDRLERELRKLTGRIEELQHDVQRLDEQARHSPQDNALRPGNPPVATTTPPPPPSASPPPGSGATQRRGDAFDPARDPAAVGAPRQLGATPPSAPLTGSSSPQTRASVSPAAPESAPPLARDPSAPLDLMHGKPAPDGVAPSAPPPDASAALPAAPGPKDEYEIALSYLHKGQYETAEKGFSAFLTKNPKSRMAPAATFNLGESYFLRGRHREAAEKYLEISAKYASSPQAPDALLRLGQSLIALGAKEQACASFTEIGVKYPNAPIRTKEAAQRESKKIPCS